MVSRPNPIPLRPQPQNEAKSFVRAAFATAQGAVTYSEPSRFVGRDSAALRIIEKADAPVGSTTLAGFGDELMQNAWRDFIGDLAPYGAASALVSRSIRGVADPYEALNYPIRAAGPTLPSFVAEGDAIPVRSAAFSTVAVGPSRKLCHMVVWSRELGKRSDAEAIFGRMLREDVAAGIDAALLSTAAASTSTPAGLLNSVVAGTGHPGGDAVSLETDLTTLADTVATGGSGAVLYIVAPQRLAKLKVFAPLLAERLDVVASNAVPAGRVIAIDPGALIIATDPNPDLVASTEAVLHMSDAPLPIVSGAPVTSDPVASMYQVAATAVRVLHFIAFSKTRASAVAFTDSVSW